MKKKLIIVSGGAFGREVRDLAVGIQSALGHESPWQLAGFLDDRHGIDTGALPVIGSPHSYQPDDNDLFVCAIGDPVERGKYAGLLRGRGGKFAFLREPSAKVGGGAEISDGVAVGPFCVVSCDVTIGADTFLTTHVTVGHDVRIGRLCQVSAYAFIGGGTIVGDCVRIFPHASILPGVRIGDGATIGAGSVVTRDVFDGQTVFGVPALPVAG